MEPTLEQAKQLLRDAVKIGEAIECPCCKQMVKIYKRKLNSGMAKALLLIYKISNPLDFNYIHVQNEFNKLGFNAISLDIINSNIGD